MEALIREWFAIWTNGNFEDLPIAEDFQHTSPYGTVQGKAAYLDLVATNKEQFLGQQFHIHDILILQNKACVRYVAEKGDFKLDVSEWHYYDNGLIQKVIAYYNVDEPRIAIE